jgi:hypothetical protein
MAETCSWNFWYHKYSCVTTATSTHNLAFTQVRGTNNHTHICTHALQPVAIGVKLKLKAALWGLFYTEDHWRIIVPLSLNEVPLFISRGAAHQQAWALSASEGRNYVYLNLASKFVIHERTRFFYMPQSWDMGQMFYFPSEGRHAEDFFNRTRERTRDLGYQRPAC